MGPGSHRHLVGAAAILVAALACLQPAIDPVFLTLLSAARGVDPADHGWIVSATQVGMAAGSLLLWRLDAGLHRIVVLLAALGALLSSLVTAGLSAFYGLVAIRALYGFAMGILYTEAMSRAAAVRPTGAYAAVFLVQLILATLAALALPAMAEAMGAAMALALLALGPVLVFALAAVSTRGPEERPAPSPAGVAAIGARHDASPSGWALAAATFCFICATMMIWSFTGALATAAGLGEESIGFAVAVGSLAGALTAILVMQEQPRVPLVLTGVMATFCLVAPLVLTPLGEEGPFVASILLLNIGSTAAIVRASGIASARSAAPLFRRFVAATHPLGMIAGPVIGSLLMRGFGDSGLIAGAVVALVAGCLMLVFAAVQDHPLSSRRTPADMEKARDPVMT